MLESRKTVKTLKEYHPPLGGRQGLRLDFNENVGGCSPRVLEKLRSLSPEVLNKYPERDPGERTVAEFLKLRPEQVLLTNGVDEGIHLLAETYLEEDDEAVIVVPTFSMYEIYALATSARVISIPAGPDFAFPSAALLTLIGSKTKLICIANPNNPTGSVVSRELLIEIAESAPNTAVLIDEAYFDFYGDSLVNAIGEYENLFIARTFSKAYGLAGFRMGVLCGAESQMRLVKRVASPYNVNGVALECLPEALADQDFVSSYVAQVKRGRSRLEQFYRERSIEFWPSKANFVLAYFGDYRKQFVEEMRLRGILVRDRNSDPGCAGCVRITLGTDEQTNKLLRELPLALESIGFQTQVRELRLTEAKR
jgi:histidinol-phosphate aminotransferase